KVCTRRNVQFAGIIAVQQHVRLGNTPGDRLAARTEFFGAENVVQEDHPEMVLQADKLIGQVCEVSGRRIRLWLDQTKTRVAPAQRTGYFFLILVDRLYRVPTWRPKERNHRRRRLTAIPFHRVGKG